MAGDSRKDVTEKYSGGLFRAYLGAVSTLGLRDAVYAAVPPHVRRMMDAPPLHTAWQQGDELGYLFSAVAKLQGLEGMRRAGYEATRTTTGRFMRPMIQTTLAMYGRSPVALFTHLGSICRPFFRGLEFDYTPLTSTSGSLRLRTTYRMNAVSYAAWEGSLRILFDECNVTTGSIAPAVISEGGHTGTMLVSW